jgi:hypothetical protein
VIENIKKRLTKKNLFMIEKPCESIGEFTTHPHQAHRFSQGNNMSDIGRVISIIQKIEAEYPQLSTSKLVDSLRRFGNYDTDQFQMFLGTSPAADIGPKGSFSLSDRAELINNLMHDTSTSSGAGTSLDKSTNRKITLGHVIVGISAGIHHPHPIITIDLRGITITVNQFNFPRDTLQLDPLYALLFSGDLGQTAAMGMLDSKLGTTNPFGGVGGEATSEELHGDIDGFMLGNWLSTTINGQATREAMVQGNSIKLSQMLGEYYRTITTKSLNMQSGSVPPYPLESIRRFSNFNLAFQALRNTIAAQTVGFNRWYAISRKLLPNADNSLLGVSDFELWCLNGGV